MQKQEKNRATGSLKIENLCYSAFQPAGGISIAYNDMKILEVHALFDAITNGADYVTDFEFGYKIDRTVAAVIESSKTHEWVDVK